MKTIIGYLKQASTWRGIIAVITGAGVAISPELAEAIISLGVASFGVVEVVRDEKK